MKPILYVCVCVCLLCVCHGIHFLRVTSVPSLYARDELLRVAGYADGTNHVGACETTVSTTVHVQPVDAILYCLPAGHVPLESVLYGACGKKNVNNNDDDDDDKTRRTGNSIFRFSTT